MTIPSEEEVMASVTDEEFWCRNWEKHRDDMRYPAGGYQYCRDYAEYDGNRFTRQHVFDHFTQSTAKGVISAIKWGYPKGVRPGGMWRAFSDAFRSNGYTDAINEFRAAPESPACGMLSR